MITFFLFGDFNCEVSNDFMLEFCNRFNLTSLIKENTCFKCVQNPSCIELILTNRPNSFQNSMVIETGLSDFHKLTATVLKTSFRKMPPKVVQYINYKTFSHAKFRNEIHCLVNWIDIFDTSNDDFVAMLMNILNNHAPLKQKYVRSNDNPFVTKELRKEHMLRSKLRNKYYEEKTNASALTYKGQRNKCVPLLKKAKKLILEI